LLFDFLVETRSMDRRLFAAALAALFMTGAPDAHADGEMRARGPETTKSSVQRSSTPKGDTLLSADHESLAIATGHYARSRSLLLAAIREFDAGYKLANPDLILDSKIFRNTLISRAKELEHVLDPQPRASKTGVRFNPDTRLLADK